jgi:GH15 family glucan-1,4-alpha-glucosidase
MKVSSTASPDGARAEAAPSPFTPIADYGFLSNCRTGALVAPDGTVDWLCVPRFDSPSMFGALPDYGAGGFSLWPFGINVPRARIYEPRTNTLVSSGVESGRHPGNFPQAFSHLALVEPAARIIVAESITELGAGPPREGA